MAWDDTLKELQESRKRLDDLSARLEATYMKLFLAMPGSLTQHHSGIRWELNPEKSVNDLDKDYEEYLEEMSRGGKPYRERR